MRHETGERLCSLLAEALHGGTKTEPADAGLMELAQRHKVLPLLYEQWKDMPQVCRISRQTAQQSYHLLFLSRYVQQTLAHAGIEAILLKGSATAELYPLPELRKSGDVDLLLADEQAVASACRCLTAHGFTHAGEQLAQHHAVLCSPDGISVELHRTLAEPFADARVNRCLLRQQETLFAGRVTQELLGLPFTVLAPPHHLYYLLLHMLQHFMRAGFGYKLLCDWVVFLERGLTLPEQEAFLQLTRESGTLGFAASVTSVCVRYLGLSAEKGAFLLQRFPVGEEETQALFDEITEAEEFGHSDSSRLVVLRGTGALAYLRELHHQTCLTYPRASRIAVLMPFLWVRMLCGFLYRNRSLRGVSAIEVLRKARARTRMTKKMRLFER